MKMLITAPLSDVLDKYPDVSTLLATFRLPEDKSSSISASLDLTDVSRPELLKEIRQALSLSVCEAYTRTSLNDLINIIVKSFHEAHRAQMPGLINDARYIEKRYALHPDCPRGITTLLISFFEDLVNHMDQEELFLFPALIEAENFTMFCQLVIAHHSHDRHLNFLEDLRLKTGNFKAPTDASAQWVELYERLLEFYFQLNIHITIENRFLLEA